MTQDHIPGIHYHHPEPPVNVRLAYADGVIVPVDCTYHGWVGTEQAHVWVTINPRPTEIPEEIMVGMLPPQTSIVVGVIDGE